MRNANLSGMTSGILKLPMVIASCVCVSTGAGNCIAADTNAQTTEVSAAAAVSSTAWGQYSMPFAADSLWNSRPVAPVFGTFVIPKSDYFPSISEGKWSTGVFLSSASDGPVTVTGLPGGKGLWDPDAEAFHDVTIPRWPANVIPASGADGHADVVDPIAGRVHSFYQLKFQDGRWTASQYAWSRIDGRGWGDPAHYFQGARASGVPTMAGLIRKHEVQDGRPMYSHALAMALTFNALSQKPSYVYPATSADTGAATTNSGVIPEGALLMLPPSYDTQQIADLDLRKVAETLKVYGAYVVDRNHGTPFAIYVENGSGFNLHKNGWNSAVASELNKIRQSLRQVISASGFLDGNGRRFEPARNLNLLSMRGPWDIQSGTTPGTFDTWTQSIVFPATSTRTVMVNNSSRGLNAVSWSTPPSGVQYRLAVTATNGARMQFQIVDRAIGKKVFDSGELGDGQSSTFAWPASNAAITVYAMSGVGSGSTVRGELLRIDQ